MLKHFYNIIKYLKIYIVLNYFQCDLARHFSTIFYLGIPWFLKTFDRKSDALLFVPNNKPFNY